MKPSQIVTFEPDAGDMIEDAASMAVLLSASLKLPARFRFNDVAVIALPTSTLRQVVDRYYAELQRRGGTAA